MANKTYMEQSGVRGSLDAPSRGLTTSMPKINKMRGNSLMGAGAGSLGIASTPRGLQLATTMYDSAPAFTISPDKGIPGKGSIS